MELGDSSCIDSNSEYEYLCAPCTHCVLVWCVILQQQGKREVERVCEAVVVGSNEKDADETSHMNDLASVVTPINHAD